MEFLWTSISIMYIHYWPCRTHRHMHFSYHVELPYGTWDCKTGPSEPDTKPLSPEAYRAYGCYKGGSGMMLLLLAFCTSGRLVHVSLILWRSLKSGQQFKVSFQEASQLPKRAIVENLQKVLHLSFSLKYRLQPCIMGILGRPELKEQDWFAPFRFAKAHHRPLRKKIGIMHLLSPWGTYCLNQRRK